jgi:putative nucleotidyltransferase with HDIG domain
LIILTTYGQANAFELTLYYGISSMLGVLFPRKEKRITAYIWVGLTVAASGAATITAFRLPLHETSGMTLATISAITFLNGIIAAGLTVLMQYLLAPVIGQITPLQLLELSRPDHPLLEYLLRSAPGTYQHSLQVANLAEQAAERINADSLLTRVGALYHDIGKTQNAQFFVENQVPGQLDTHEHLDPKESAYNIIQHVNDGVSLGEKYRLPRRIQNFITEHHGTNKAKYQWTQAVKKANGDLSQLNEEYFKYGGPQPQSRETALVMLADGCEARVRAKRPSNEEELQAIVKESIDSCLSSGQLDDTTLTLRDLKTINESFTANLRGIYHPRVEYPSLELEVPTRPIKGTSKEGYPLNGLPGLEIQPIPSEQPTHHD